MKMITVVSCRSEIDINKMDEEENSVLLMDDDYEDEDEMVGKYMKYCTMFDDECDVWVNENDLCKLMS